MGKAVTAIIAIVVLVLAGLGIYIYKHPSDAVVAANSANVIATSDTSATTTGPTYIIATSTASTYDTNTSVATVTTKPKVVVAYAPSHSPVPFGNSFHSSTFGLTIPGLYNVSETSNIFSDVPNSATFNFYSNGTIAFTINVWSREQWSKLRNEETWNADNGNTAGTYFGEGTYLGENETWIFSLVPNPYAPSGVRFY